LFGNYYKSTFIFLGMQIDKQGIVCLLPESGKMFLPMADVAELWL